MEGIFKKLAFMAVTGSLAPSTIANDADNTNAFEGKKVVIVYYSHSGETYNSSGNIYLEKGNTEVVAEKIQKHIEGSKIVKLDVKEKYPTGYEKMIEYVKKQQEKGVLPELEKSPDVSEFDIIFVGTPVWWGKMSLPVESFLKSEACKGKIIIPFITHEGSGESGIGASMEDLSGCEKVLKSLVIKGSKANTETTDETIKTFLDNIELKVFDS